MQTDNIWPTPKFYFQVQFGDTGTAAFQEVSGLDMESDVIEYRDSNSPPFSTIHMPGLKKASDITLKKGMFKDDTALFDWFNQVKMNAIVRKTVTISLMDESGNPTMTWTLANAYPIKITGTDVNSQGSEVAVEEIVLAHEGLTMAQ